MSLKLFPKHHIRYFHIKYLIDSLSEVRGKVLDVGCGWGMTAAQLKITRPELEIVACDNNIGYLALCKEKFKKTDVNWVHCEAESLAFKKKEFSAVYLLDVLEHLKKPEKAIAEISRVLKRGGLFYLVVPLEGGLTSIDGWIKKMFGKNFKRTPLGHLQQFNLNDIREMLKTHGFKIKQIRCSYYFFYQIISLIYYLYIAGFKRGKYAALRSENKVLNKILSAIIMITGYLVFLENKLASSFKGQTAHITVELINEEK